MTDFIECVANFSEGRNKATMAALQTAVRSVHEVHLLDTHSDADHNRTVLTFVGPPEATKWAAYRAIQVACETINMDQHRGVHPRIGAADVIPFVPISAEQLPTCIEIARELAEQVGHELEIPVYCYGEAAFDDQTRNLEQIRAGQYEWLKENIGRDADRSPDFGPARLGPAGATAIGARGPLIAFNVYLASAEIDIARKIARKIRHSAGGLACVKALGLLVGGQAQISMNLTDHRITSISNVVQAIENEALQFQVRIDRSELVGLMPLAAMTEDAQHKWYLPELRSEHILERRISQIRETCGVDFTTELASPDSMRYGVAAAAQTGEIAAALVRKIIERTSSYTHHEEKKRALQVLAAKSQDLQNRYAKAVTSDVHALETFRDLQEKGKDTQHAWRDLIRSPLECLRLASEVLSLAHQAAEKASTKFWADCMIVGELALAVRKAAECALRVNLANCVDPKFITQVKTECAQLYEDVSAAYQSLRTLDENRS